MKTYLQVNLADRTAELLGGGEWTPPALDFGEQITLAMRFVRTVEGTTSEYPESVESARAAIGKIDARPESGTTKLQIGSGVQTSDNTTAEIHYNATAADWKAAIVAKTVVTGIYGAPVVTMVDGSVLIVFGQGAEQVPMQLRNNRLRPTSFGQVKAWQEDGRWVHEIRLIQLPVEQTSDAPVVLPPSPSITQIQDGGTDGTVSWNEIQALYIPPEFRGTYQLKMGYARTALLSRSDGAEDIQTALAGIDEGFRVTNPLPNVAHIEFAGENMAGLSQALLEVVVANAPAGDVTLTLDTERADLLALLRRSPEVELTLSVWLEVTDTADDTVKEVAAFRVPITLRRPLHWDELAEVPNVDWLRRPSPTDYLHSSVQQTITGQQGYTETLGDGVLEEFTIDHNLDSAALHLTIIDNNAGGAALVNGTDFTWTVDSNNAITVTMLTGAPAVDALFAVITAAGSVEALNNHLHTVEQITGLSTILDDLGGRLTDLEDRFPPDDTIQVPTVTGTMVIEFPEMCEALFSGVDDLPADERVDAALLPKRAARMLPAVHDVSTTDPLPTPLPAAAAETVWVSDRKVLIPGGGKIRSAYVLNDGHVASDGRMLYPATRQGETDSYYPAAFERELWSIFITEKMLAVGKTLTVRFGVGTQLIAANSKAQWVLVIELGTAPDEAVGDPDSSGVDLENVEWDTENPILSERLILMPGRIVHSAGCIIQRNEAALLCTRLMDFSSEAVNELAPATANFALRARLINFDTENRETEATGWVVLQLTAPGENALAATIS